MAGHLPGHRILSPTIPDIKINTELRGNETRYASTRMSRYQASELSNKVKVINLVEENILKKRLEIYNRQEKRSLRVIEKESKKVEADMKEKLLKPCSVFDWHNSSFTDEMLNFNGSITTPVRKKLHRNDHPKVRSRRLKKQSIVDIRENDTDQENDNEELIPAGDIVQQMCNGTPMPDIHRITRKVKFREEDKHFLPDISHPGSLDSSDASSTDTDAGKRPEKQSERFSLPAIHVTNTQVLNYNSKD